MLVKLTIEKTSFCICRKRRPNEMRIMSLFDCCAGGDDGELNSEVIMAYVVSYCSAVLDSWQVDGVIIRVFNL